MTTETREIRKAIELRSEGTRLIGYAAVFGARSLDLGGFVETVSSGAFDRALSERQDVVALWDHDRRSILGRTQSGTLRLRTDARGLIFEIDAPNTSTGKDVLEMVGRGDVTGASFAFTAKEVRWTDGDVPVRELIDLDLHDVTITPNPAYPDTEVARRHFEAHFLPQSSPERAWRERQIRLMEIG